MAEKPMSEDRKKRFQVDDDEANALIAAINRGPTPARKPAVERPVLRIKKGKK